MAQFTQYCNEWVGNLVGALVALSWFVYVIRAQPAELPR